MTGQRTKSSINKVKTPFSSMQRSKLLSWSKRAKEGNLLPPFERKILYECGHYNYIFLSRLYRLSKTLDMLIDHVGDDAGQIADIKNVGDCCYLEAQSNAGDPEAIKNLVAKAKERGYVTIDEMNKAMPVGEVTAKQIEDTMTLFSELEVNVIESEES